MVRLYVQAFEASAVIGAYLIVAFSDPTNNSKVAPATGSAARLVGTTGRIGASAAGQMVDVERLGQLRVSLGGTVAAGDPLTSDANAKAIKATVAGQRIIGFADAPGNLNDAISYFGAPGVLGA